MDVVPKIPSMSAPETPVMRPIEEEGDSMSSSESDIGPLESSEPETVRTDLRPPALAVHGSLDSKSHTALLPGVQNGAPIVSHSFYRNQDSNNNSSSSIIYNAGFKFGGSTTSGNSGNPEPMSESRRNSLRYVPNSKAPPATRNKSPVRTRSPVRNRSPVRLSASPERVFKRSSIYYDGPFNVSSTLQQTPPSSASRASFRKGHRYKHSSVSMNFFQEPEVTIPLNIAKSLPIPDFRDLIANISWPEAHIKMGITLIQLIACLLTFQVGQAKNWVNFVTLSHFITYDVIGAIVIMFVESLAQFQVWSTGTITFPFGLNRVDVLLSFALAVSFCFVGLDLLFHIIEEFVVIFIESSSSNDTPHEEFALQIPHSHHTESVGPALGDRWVWYSLLLVNIVVSGSTLIRIYYANKHSKLKTKNPLITIAYASYLLFYPILISYLSVFTDYVATFCISVMILSHGYTIAEWTSTMLLMGFSTTSISGLTLLDSEDFAQDHLEKLNNSASNKQHGIQEQKSNIEITKKTGIRAWIDKLLNIPVLHEKRVPDDANPSKIKAMLKGEIENLPEFKSRCAWSHDNITILKINFDTYIALIKLSMKGGSNDDELNLRISMDKSIRKILSSVETTIEIDRI